ncbi:MAG TPA: dihydrofolate reductase family protein [Mucilaginibacter sp.]
MKIPRVICHMATAVNGRILTANWGDENIVKKFSALYEKCHQSFNSQAWMCGRVTMEKDFASDEPPQLVTPPNPITREPFIGNKQATSFAIAIDGKGKLGWDDNEINGDHIIEVLSDEVSDEYLYYLQQKNISYLFAGKKQLDFALALQQLATLFPIKTIMLEGGGYLNGSMLNAELIDELSILLLPIADGAEKTQTTFEVSDYLPERPASLMKLARVEQLEHDVLWLNYQLNQ